MARMTKDDRSRVLGIALFAAIGSACASIMGVEDPIPRTEVTDSGPDGRVAPTPGEGGSSCRGPGCACVEDADCKDAVYKRCVSGRCSECTTNPDSCPIGRYCVAGQATRTGSSQVNECAPGCSSNEACTKLTGKAAPYCNLERHQCVACTKETEITDCTNRDQVCSPAGVCADTCATGSCPKPGETCCDGLCVDTTKDVFHCGVCNAACGAGETLCCSGQCKNPLTSTDACGLCTNDCNAVVKNATGITCASSKCSFAACTPSFANCDNDGTNGCECDCPAVCNGGCSAGVCLINVTPTMSGGVTCPPGMPCKVVCARSTVACTGTILCAPGQACSVHCNGAGGCFGAKVEANGATSLCLECDGDPGCRNVVVNKGTSACSKACHACDGCTGSCDTCAPVTTCP